MSLSDVTFLRLRGIVAWLGVLPIGLFVLFHLIVHATALGGADVYNAVSVRLERLPFVQAIELGVIALPLVAHVVLGIALGNSEPASRLPHRYASDRLHASLRATGAFLTIWVVFHVWSTRMVPEVARREADLFTLVREQLDSPLVLAGYAAGIVAVALHFGIGLTALAPPADARARRLGIAAATAVLVIGLAALGGFLAHAPRTGFVAR